MQKEIYNLTVEPIACVHVGTGNTLTPLDYGVSKTKQDNKVFVKYSRDKLLSRMEGGQKMTAALMRASGSGNMKDLRKFFKENWKPSELEYICHATNEFLRKYNKEKNGDPLDNVMEAREMYRAAGKFAPAIPGSSLKGSARTAALNSYMQQAPEFIKNQLKGCSDLFVQKKLLGNCRDAKTGSFRAVETSD